MPRGYGRGGRRRRVARPRRRYGRRYPRRPRLGLGNRVYNFKRTLFLENSIGVTAAGTLYSNHFGFTLGMLPAATDFTNLFDQYRINKVVWKAIPKFNTVNALSGAGNALLAQVHTAIDYDDSAALPTGTALSEITQYQTHRMHRGTAVVRRTIVPKAELTGSGASVFPKAYQWIDCDNTAILHNGIKVVIPKPLPAGTEMWYDVQMDVYLSCKNVV